MPFFYCSPISPPFTFGTWTVKIFKTLSMAFTFNSTPNYGLPMSCPSRLMVRNWRYSRGPVACCRACIWQPKCIPLKQQHHIRSAILLFQPIPLLIHSTNVTDPITTTFSLWLLLCSQSIGMLSNTRCTHPIPRNFPIPLDPIFVLVYEK